MSFLFPAMLLGLLGLAVPVALHLIARHKFPVQDFPTIRLLRFERRHNVFAWQLVDPWQLLLRLLVLFLLALAMARFFTSCLASRPAPRNLVVVLDTSASMRMEAKDPAGNRAPLGDMARAQAELLIRQIAAPSRCAVLAAGDEVTLLAPLLPETDRALASLPSAKPGDGTGPGLLRAVADACDMVRGRREVRSQVVVLTDLRATAFETRQQEDLRRIRAAQEELGSALEIVFVNLAAGQDENLAILDATMRGGEIRVGDDAHVLARVLNSGASERPATLRLAIGGRSVAQTRALSLPPGGEAVVDLVAPVNRALRAFGEVQFQESDALSLDDHRLVPVNVADSCRVLIVRTADRAAAAPSALGQLGGAPAAPAAAEEPVAEIGGAIILRYVLNPGRELGLSYSTGIESTLSTPDAIATQPLSKYDIIALYDVSDVPDKALADLDAFVRSGKSVLLFCSAGCNPVRFNRTLAAGVKERPALAPALIGNDKELKPPAGIGLEATRHPVLAPYRDRLQGDLSVLRFSHIREIQSLADNATVLFQAADGSPLAIEKKIEQGRVVLLTFGLELDRSNIARTRAFPVLMWRLADHLTGRLASRRPDVLPAAAPAVLDVSENAFAFDTALDLVPTVIPREGETGATNPPPAAPAAPTPLSISSDRTVLVPARAAGAYSLQKPRRDAGAVVSYSRPVAVNPDPRESRMERLSADEIQKRLGTPIRVAALDKPLDLSVRGFEFWTLLVVLLILAYAVEAAAGFWVNARREKERVATGGEG